jgi:shikimate 5-dehydrogenase
VLKGDVKSALAGGEHALLEMVMATHAGMTTDEFEKVVTDWITTAKHPKTGRLFTEMVYQPMLELLAYLRANGFKYLHRFRRWHRVHAPVDGAGLWHPARTGHRQ